MEQTQEINREAIKTGRVIGKYDQGVPGNLLLITAGVHGNEPSGVLGLRQVFKRLEKDKIKIKGTLLGLAGNVEALNSNKRYIDADLNRVWPDGNFKTPDNPNHEEQEMTEIWEVLQNYPAHHYKERHFVDCHTTSSQSLPYISVQEIGDNDNWAHRFQLYIVRGFSDLIEGSIDNFFSKNNFTGFAYEAGQHTDAKSVYHQEAIIWMAMDNAGLLDLQNLDPVPESVKMLVEKEEQKTFEIIHRHHLDKGDTFEMEPGYKNFQEIKKGELLGTYNGEEIVSRWNARIFMPLYQKQGNDGFFVVQEV